MKCVEVQELTKQLQLQSRGHHDDLSLNGLLTAAQNCTDKGDRFQDGISQFTIL